MTPQTKLEKLGIFMQLKMSPCMDAKLSDIGISTSAAPTYLPAHNFKNQDPKGNVHEFNLIDGGVCANNPVSIKHSLIINLITYLITNYM